jgi:hypothetical protein
VRASRDGIDIDIDIGIDRRAGELGVVRQDPRPNRSAV